MDDNCWLFHNFTPCLFHSLQLPGLQLQLWQSETTYAISLQIFENLVVKMVMSNTYTFTSNHFWKFNPTQLSI